MSHKDIPHSRDQALDLLESALEMNGHELNAELESWLTSEFEFNSPSDERVFDRTLGRLYEGIFQAVRRRQALRSDSLWNAAVDRFSIESRAAGETSGKEKQLELHNRLSCLYWMVRLSAEELTRHFPRIRLLRLFVTAEKELREAFIPLPGEIQIPRHLIRKRQWRLLDEYGMGLHLEELYDLSPPDKPTEIPANKKLWLAVILGIVIGFVLGVWWASPPGP